MRHLISFNESTSFSVQEYFKDKIDWKFLQYLEDTSLEYSDTNHRVTINIDIDNYREIYEYCAGIEDDIYNHNTSGKWIIDQTDRIEGYINHCKGERVRLNYSVRICGRGVDEVESVYNQVINGKFPHIEYDTSITTYLKFYHDITIT